MDNEIVNALELLATKLGTTTEYLWGILLKQAPISAVTDLMQYALLAVGSIIWMKKVKSFAVKIKDGDWEEENWIWILLVSVGVGVLLIVAFLSFPNTLYAIFHPEYWALDKLLHQVE